ncbi:MAG: NAD-dependent epimerase/dehydratase family protein [Defluviitaleaceae bacterium]|nr:NAD-dependent epimerase/dehydratase family protein [Defluviitaleaceae bacterium]
MKVIVLGGTKFMGVHLVNELISAGHDVTIATRGKTPDTFGNKVDRLIIDRKDPTSLRNALKGKHYNVVIDNIAYASNDVKYLLDVLSADKYILTSTVSVYAPNFHENMREQEVDTLTLPLKWCNYEDFPYDEVKRQAEAALFQAYPSQLAAAVRFPYIFGCDDYTKRLFFYIDNIINERPMHIDNLTARISFINSQEAGQFLAHVATAPIAGYVNAASNGTISLSEIIGYTEKLTSKKAIIQESGAAAPINTAPNFGLDTSKATNSGFKFKHINDWVYPLIDYWVNNTY